MENSLKLEYCKNYNNWCEKEKRTCNNCYYEVGYNMTNEEKKAIEYLKSRLYGNEGCKFIDVAQSDLRIFLNLIETQQKEIEELKTEKAKRSWVHIKENGEVEPLFYVSEDKIKRDYISKKKLYEHIEMLEKENCHETCGIKKLIDCGRQCSIGCTIKNIKKILEE